MESDASPAAWPDLRPALSHPVMLLIFRVIVGGLLLFAAWQKMRSPKAFALSIGAFEMVPRSWLVPLAFFFIWQEIAGGLCLVLGIWSRGAAFICGGLLTVFLGALGWAVVNGMSIECGCFGALFGGEIGVGSLLRNTLLIAMAAWVVAKGGGGIAVERLWARATSAEATPANA